MSRAAAAKSKDQISQKEKDQCIAVLEELLKVPGNDICADCSAKGPRWASVNIGVFVCIRCSGIHRNLGVHISKVKSVTLDFWTYDLVEVMRRVGNKRANSVFEANLPPTFRKPTESDNNYGVEQFIRDKYDRKKWYNPAAASQPVAAQSPVETKKHRTEEDEQRRRERREQRRREKQQQQQLLQQQQPQQQPQPQPVQSNNNFFADFSTPQNSKQSLINFGDFQSFSTPSQPQPQTQQPQPQPQPQPQIQSVPQPQPTQPQSSAFANSNAEFFGTVDTKAKEKEDILALFRTPAAQAYPQNTGFPTNQAYGYNQFQGGFQSNGYQGNNGGFQSNGFQSSGFQSGFQGNNGGFQSNGFQSSGFQSSGFQSNGFQSNGFQSNGFQQPNNGFANSGFGNNNFGFVSPNQASGNNSFQF